MTISPGRLARLEPGRVCIIKTRALGADVSEPRFHLPISNADRQWAQETLAGVPAPRIVLNVGARWPTKRWPPEHYAEIGRRAASEYGAGLIAVGSALDRPVVA